MHHSALLLKSMTTSCNMPISAGASIICAKGSHCLTSYVSPISPVQLMWPQPVAYTLIKVMQTWNLVAVWHHSMSTWTTDQLIAVCWNCSSGTRRSHIVHLHSCHKDMLHITCYYGNHPRLFHIRKESWAEDYTRWFITTQQQLYNGLYDMLYVTWDLIAVVFICTYYDNSTPLVVLAWRHWKEVRIVMGDIRD